MVPAAFVAGLGVGLSFLIGPMVGAIALVPVIGVVAVGWGRTIVLNMMQD